MGFLKFIAAFFACLSSYLFVNNIITSLTIPATKLSQPWKPNAKMTGTDIMTLFRWVTAIIASIGWGILIVF